MAKVANQISNEQLDLYTTLLKTHPNIELKGVSMPYTSLNGHMYTFLSDAGVGIRLPEDARKAFLEKYRTTLYKTQGTTLKEYVTVPDKLLKNTKKLQEYLDISYRYVSTLKPKSSKKKG